MSRADAFDADAIKAATVGQLIGREIVVLEETTSTNDVVAHMAAAHAAGLVVFAEQQTSGRGQYGRRWESAPGRGLWLSVLLRPKIPVTESSRLTHLLARTIATTIERQSRLSATIKPPNDVYLSDRKVAGVLVEMRVEPGGDYCAVAGMGINLNQTPEEFPPELREIACSLAMATRQPVNRTTFAIALLQELEEQYRAFCAR